MSNTQSSRTWQLRIGWGAAFVAATLVGVPFTTADAAPTTVPVYALINSQAFGGAGCSSPFNLCATGTVKGSLNGPFELAVTNVIPSPTPGVVFATAPVTFHDILGDLNCTEDFAYNATPGSDGEFGVICRITGGTRRWSGATGYLQGYGTVAPSGATTGTIVGKITLP